MNRLTDEEIFRFLDQELPEKDRLRIQHLLEEDPELKAYVEQIRQTEIVARSSALETAPENFTEKVLIGLADQVKVRKAFDSRPWRFVVIMVGLLTAGLVLATSLGNSSETVMFLPSYDQVQPVIAIMQTALQSHFFMNASVVICGILALILFDIYVLRPIFSSRRNNVAV